jgi:glycosyltransferase involved in cell wall biosynthesis
MNPLATDRVPVSFIIPVKNEARNLPRCIGSIAWAGEIFVVDSHSTDETVAVASRMGATVVQFDFNGIWPKKKNWALETLPFANDWIFILDADEVLPPDARAEIQAIVTDPHSECAGYWINRRFMFMGQWLKHAYFPNWNMRLFRHQLGRFEQLANCETASGDNEVHEHVVIQGQTGRLSCLMDHYAFPDVDTFIEKHNRYSNWEARVALDAVKGDSHAIQDRHVSWKRRLKGLAARCPFRPFLRFCYVYFFQLGILDGKAGFYFARLHGIYEFMTVAKLFELKRAHLKKS